jgi:hypothetical protein
MNDSPFIHCVIPRNYKSIGYCDVPLGPLTDVAGIDGPGKNNFPDALHHADAPGIARYRSANPEQFHTNMSIHPPQRHRYDRFQAGF